MTDQKNPVADLAPESLEPTLNRPSVKKGGKKSGNLLVTILVIIIIVAAVIFYLDASGKVSLFGSSQDIPEATFESGDWQAVFLTNGQVYFGNLKNPQTAYPEMTNIYYLQVQQVPIQPAQAANPGEAGVQPAQQYQEQLILVKFGTELHKPKDRMYINKDHILMYEDLEDDSPVIASIEDYVKNQAEQAAQAAAAPEASAPAQPAAQPVAPAEQPVQ